jgi:hypothetical protein
LYLLSSRKFALLQSNGLGLDWQQMHQLLRWQMKCLDSRLLHAINLEEIPESYRDFPEVFDVTNFAYLPEHREWDHTIDLLPDSDNKVHRKVYPLNPKEQVELDKFLEENLNTSHICSLKSSFASLFFFVNKTDNDELCPIQDYQKLNDIIVKNQYPLPLISDILHCLKQSKIFMKMDICWGFNNVQIKEGNKWKAAFITNCSLYKPLVIYWSLQCTSYLPEDDEQNLP